MVTLVHVYGQGRGPLPPLRGHLVRNLEWDRFREEFLDDIVAVVVASPASPADGMALVSLLREGGHQHPVILVSDGSPGWESVAAAALPGVSLVEEDLAGLAVLLGDQNDAGSVPPDHPLQPTVGESEVIDLRRLVPRGGSRGMLRERLGDKGQSFSQSMHDFDRMLVADRVRGHVSVDEQTAEQVMAPRAPEHRQPEQSRADQTTGKIPKSPGSRRGRREVSDPDLLVPALMAVSDRLYGVRETGTAVATHVKEVVGVDAVAVLVPDGSVWTVVGAVGHRHLEERLVLGADHWLVAEVSQAHHAVMIEDTDIARTRLAGAPLAAWPHLVACPLPEVSGIVVAARSDNGPAFTAHDLTRASGALHDAGALFVSATQVRDLARRLRTFAELDDPTI